MPEINLSDFVSGHKTIKQRLIQRGVDELATGATSIANELGASLNSNLGAGGIGDTIGLSDIRLPEWNPRTKGELGSLYTGERGGSVFIFPEDLDDHHYIKFRGVRVNRARRDSESTETVLGTLVLPVPPNLGLNYSAEYDNTDLGGLGAGVAGQVDFRSVLSGSRSIADAIKTYGGAGLDGTNNSARNAVGDTAAASAAVAASSLAASSISGLLGLLAGGVGAANVAQGLGKRFGVALNPHMTNIFKGVGFKNHTFAFKFIPRNQKESAQIKQMIFWMKNLMLPSFGPDQESRLYFQYPDEFDIAFSTTLAHHLYSFQRCVLTSMNVTYNGSGVPSFSEDGAPMEIDISLNFQETSLEISDQNRDSTYLKEAKARDDRNTQNSIWT